MTSRQDGSVGGGAHRTVWATWLSRLALVLLGLALPLVVLELALRIAGPILPGNYSTGTDLVAHPIFGHFHQPNYSGWQKTSEFTTFKRINSKGLRERELPYDKPANTERVLLLGDSFVEGEQVDASQTLSTQLEQLLNGRGQRYETINAGVDGFGTANEYLLYREEAYRYQSDVVILVFFIGNDVGNNRARRGNSRIKTKLHGVLDAAGNLRPFRLPPRHRNGQSTSLDGITQAARQTLLFNVFESGVLRKHRDEDADPSLTRNDGEGVFQRSPTKDWVEAWAITEALLKALKHDVDAHGSRLVLVAAPADLQVRPSDWERLLVQNELSPRNFDLEQPNRLLAGIADRLSLPLIDPLAELREADAVSKGGLYYHQNRHWTAEGHAVMARVVDEGLARFGIVPNDR